MRLLRIRVKRRVYEHRGTVFYDFTKRCSMDSKQFYRLSEISESVLLSAGLPPMSYFGLWRAGRYGTVARNGQRIHLLLDRSGGKLYTTLTRIRRYLDALNEADCEYFRTARRPNQSPNRQKKVHRCRRSKDLAEAERAAAQDGL